MMESCRSCACSMPPSCRSSHSSVLPAMSVTSRVTGCPGPASMPLPLCTCPSGPAGGMLHKLHTWGTQSMSVLEEPERHQGSDAQQGHEPQNGGQGDDDYRWAVHGHAALGGQAIPHSCHVLQPQPRQTAAELVVEDCSPQQPFSHGEPSAARQERQPPFSSSADPPDASISTELLASTGKALLFAATMGRHAKEATSGARTREPGVSVSSLDKGLHAPGSQAVNYLEHCCRQLAWAHITNSSHSGRS